MVFGFGFGGPRGVGGGWFNPASLFSSGEPGTWYDPSDVANLSWRRNLLTYSEQFDNAAWSKTRAVVNANATTAPNETNTAEKLIEDTTASNTHVLRQSPTLIAGTAYTYSIYAKAAGRDFCRILVGDTGGNNAVYVDVNLNNGSIASGTNGIGWTLVAASATAVGGGWYRVVVSGTSATNTNGVVLVYIASGLGTIVYTGDGTSGIYIWGAQLEVGSTATDYQRITDVHTEVRERFPNATLYQDTASTQPVTTAAQSVALMLDKSRGLTLGAELVAPINFTSGWSASGSAVTFDSAATFTAAGIANVFRSLFTVGAWYRVDIRATFTGGVVLYNSNTALNPIGSALVSGQTQTFYFNAAAAQLNFRTTSAGTVTVDNISVRELPGNHATQAITASRPIYAVEPTTGRRNLLTYTEDFSNAAWLAATGTPTRTAVAAPDGSTTAWRITTNATDGGLYQGAGFGTGNIGRMGVTTKAGTSSTLRIQDSVSGNGAYVDFNLAAGTVGAPTSVGTGNSTLSEATITALGDGWYRCEVNALRGSTSSNFILYVIGASGSTLDVWRPQSELGSTATAYQRVVSKYDVTEAGVPSRSYLSFDGIDDFMVTPTITPGIDKAQVFAGVRKLSDANAGMVLELSASTSANAGAFYLTAPESTGALSNFTFKSRGSINPALFANSGTFLAPVSAVLVGLGDIAGDTATIRTNGTPVVYSADQGTGNLLAYPLYIGRRGGTSLPFNGNIYGMIVRFGANLSNVTILSTETWLNNKTGAY